MSDRARCTACGHEAPARDLTVRNGRIVCDECARHLDQQKDPKRA